ncbi:ankyrin repeat and SOCS box protein 8-like [Ornithodoros turicata]|uniref:ankyrin repeat and SOCS box protein 8-like n=1 Tax=Ornithodoros turicata TaxID=34597 RepID=UPI003138DEED
MWYLMENVQRSYTLSERLLRAIGIGNGGTRHEQEDVEDLIRQGADVNQSHGTFLPLHCACMVGDASNVSILLKWGASVNRYDGYHRSALHHAVERSAECVRLLLSAGADTESTDINRNTPLHWAAFRNRADCCRLLLENNALADSLDFNNDTPLNWAAMKGNYASVKVLLEYNASPDIKNYSGMLPLTRVAILLATGLETPEDEQSFELLLRGMGKVELRDRQGLLPSVLDRDGKLRTRLLSMCSSPRPLVQLGRHAVRRSLRQRHLPTIVPTLPIPERLQEFVLLES